MAAVSKSICWLMLAITPLDIKILMTWIGLACVRCAKSRTVTLTGSSIFLRPFSPINTSLTLLTQKTGWVGVAGM